MKTFILSIAIFTGFAACNNSTKQDNARDIQLLTDTTAYRNNIYSDTTRTVAPDPVTTTEAKVAPKVITVTKRIIYTPAPPTNRAPVYQPPVTSPDVATTTPVPATTTTGDNTAQAGGGTTDSNQTASTTTQAEKKEGWSSAAKGAAIGAGAGAIGGAIIAKKKGLGAIVGGVVGAAGGYIIGKDIDKRNNKLIEDQ
ncbi:MAG: YMGG-like glycine zipper-containing protein [Ginsengibacter sp.]